MLRVVFALVVLASLLGHSVVAAAYPDGSYPPPPPGQYPPPPNYPPPAGYAPPGPYSPPANYPAPPLDPPPAFHDPTAETHDGTFVRLSIGPGYLHSSTTTQGSNLRIHGFGYAFGVAVGGAVAPNLIFYGQLQILNVDEPTVEVDSSFSATANGSSFDHIGIGPGLTYYFMPANAYVSASLLLGRLQGQSDSTNDIGQTDFGAAFHLAIGKEWWVSPQWSLGAALQGLIGWNHDPGFLSTFTTTGGSVVFSATYN